MDRMIFSLVKTIGVIPKRLSWLIATGCIAAAITACTVPAQREEDQASAVVGNVADEMQACLVATNTKPDYIPLWIHTPKAGMMPDEAQFGDTSLMTSDLKAPYVAWRADVSVCHSLAQQFEPLDANIFLFLRNGWTDADAVREKFIAGQITWGEANTRTTTIEQNAWSDAHSEIASMDAQYAGEADEQRQRRAAAYAALAAALQQTAAANQRYQQNQRLLDAINRPVNTSCNTAGNYTSCTSR